MSSRAQLKFEQIRAELGGGQRGQQRHAGANRLNQRRFAGRQLRASAGKIRAYFRLCPAGALQRDYP